MHTFGWGPVMAVWQEQRWPITTVGHPPVQESKSVLQQKTAAWLSYYAELTGVEPVDDSARAPQ